MGRPLFILALACSQASCMIEGLTDEGSSVSDSSVCQSGKCPADAMIQRTQSKDRKYELQDDVPTIFAGSTKKQAGTPLLAQVGETRNENVHASVAEDGRSASVSFEHGGRKRRFMLNAYSVFTEDARLRKHTRNGIETLRRDEISRTFRSQSGAPRAVAMLQSDGAVSGLFEVDNQVVQIDPASAAATGEMPRLAHNLTLMEFPKETAPDENDGNLHMPHVVPGIAEPGASGSNWAGTKWWGGGQCYPDDDNIHAFKIGITTDFAADSLHGTNLQGLIQTIVAQSSFVYEKQMNIRLEVGALELFANGATTAPALMQSCYTDNGAPGGTEGTPKLNDFTRALGEDPSTFPDMAEWQLLSGCGTCVGSCTTGLAWLGTICYNKNTFNIGGGQTLTGYFNSGVTEIAPTFFANNWWMTYAHELGHNFGGEHSFEDGNGQTGGIMDYGNGQYDGYYQFNTKHRKEQMCAMMSSAKNGGCNSDFYSLGHGPGPTPTPAPPVVTPAPTPAPPPTPPCDIMLVQEHCGATTSQHPCICWQVTCTSIVTNAIVTESGVGQGEVTSFAAEANFAGVPPHRCEANKNDYYTNPDIQVKLDATYQGADFTVFAPTFVPVPTPPPTAPPTSPPTMAPTTPSTTPPTTAAPTASPTAPPTSSNPTDTSNKCPTWWRKGKCSRPWAQNKCAVSCESYIQCYDKHINKCQTWKTNRKLTKKNCRKNKFARSCAKSCGYCSR